MVLSAKQNNFNHCCSDVSSVYWRKNTLLNTVFLHHLQVLSKFVILKSTSDSSANRHKYSKCTTSLKHDFSYTADQLSSSKSISEIN